SATYSATDSATDSATRSATDSATYSATDSATYSATYSATDSATYSATGSATRSATDSATYSATDSATDSATRSATDSATYSATDSATDSATGSATGSATRSATDSATYSATGDLSNHWVFRDDARAVANDTGVGAFGLQCAERAYNMWQGGNQWSAWDSFISFFRHIAKLPIDYSKYDHWEQLARHSGPRIVHPDFCMISDRPEILMVDDQDRPHSENGPFCRWRDGSAIYAWHGTFVPARWIEDRDGVDPIEVLKAPNVEQRAAGLAILGSRMIPALIEQKRGKFIDDSGSADVGRLFEVKLPGLDNPGRYLVAECPRNGTIMEGVPLVSDIDGLPIATAIAAQAWRIGDPQSEYCHPMART
ncbi:DUF6745 domain-containing protein, partial [Sphingomonas sp. BE137]|uniref:DUF6745 domain-containing protein n=1 Tax=Sphingomonas sp. BE137 TaxID=2817844 RepID=UPI002866B4FC|nr:hypothetical protein [Sphingomonas sp. BE137]